MNAPCTSERLEDFKSSKAWVAENGGEISRTFAAFEWFVRRHKKRLVESGQLIPGTGSAPSLCAPGLGREVPAIPREDAARRIVR